MSKIDIDTEYLDSMEFNDAYVDFKKYNEISNCKFNNVVLAEDDYINTYISNTIFISCDSASHFRRHSDADHWQEESEDALWLGVCREHCHQRTDLGADFNLQDGILHHCQNESGFVPHPAL